MPDREKVINQLDVDIQRAERTGEMLVYVGRKTAKEVLSLLKEQEAVKPVLDKQTGRIWLCGNCGSYVGFEDNDPHDPNEFDKHCRECGSPVLWDGR